MELKQNFKKIVGEENFPIWGIIGSIAVLIAFFIPQIGFEGRQGQSYSMLNHFVSELGEIGVSHLWIVFSIGLIVGGLFYVFFMIGLGHYIENKVAKLAGFIGAFSAVSCMLVGVFPMDFIWPHIIAAGLFFLGALITLFLLMIAIIIQKEDKIPKLVLLPGVLFSIIFIPVIIIFVPIDLSVFSSMDGISEASILEGFFFDRPEIWSFAIIEWAILLAIVLYLLFLSLYIYLKSK